MTLTATSFLRYHNKSGVIPPRGHLTPWLEEQKVPSLGQAEMVKSAK